MYNDMAGQVCKFYINSGTCTKGMACPFLHLEPALVVSAREFWIADRCPLFPTHLQECRSRMDLSKATCPSD